MVGSQSWALRLNQLHAYLARQLAPYGLECSAAYPPRAMMLNPPEDKVMEEQCAIKLYVFPEVVRSC